MSQPTAHTEAITWFKSTFRNKITLAIPNTPLSLDIVTAIGMQESYADAWRVTYKTRPISEVLQLCVGDPLDRSSTFPTDKNDLVQYGQHGEGQRMFDIARNSLIALAQVNPDYNKWIAKPEKFCHGFGIFQYDIQYLKEKTGDPDFFLQKKWFDFDECLKACIRELSKVINQHYAGLHSLTDEQLTYVAIGYNTGPNGVIIGGGFKQGHRDTDAEGKFYGEHIAEYLSLAHSIP